MGYITEEHEAKIVPGAAFAQGRYRLLRQLGEGGMGSVWEAQQRGIEGFSKAVALKLMLAQDKREEARRLFLNEARLSARLHHPNIVRIYDLGQDGSIDYIAMERIDGKDLDFFLESQRFRGQRGLPWPIFTRVMIDACKGLSYAHTKSSEEDGKPLRLIHRDLKPGNILITNNGYAKIIDFGIAKSETNRGKTQTGAIKGTPGYMAPEQLNGDGVLDHRADIFSLGAILYELACGRPAFRGDNLFSIIFAIQSHTPTSPRELNPELPVELEEIIFRCLHKDREQRFATTRELQHALEDLMYIHGKRTGHEEVGEFARTLRAAFDEEPELPPEPELLEPPQIDLEQLATIESSDFPDLGELQPSELDAAALAPRSSDVHAQPTQFLEAAPSKRGGKLWPGGLVALLVLVGVGLGAWFLGQKAQEAPLSALSRSTPARGPSPRPRRPARKAPSSIRSQAASAPLQSPPRRPMPRALQKQPRVGSKGPRRASRRPTAQVRQIAIPKAKATLVVRFQPQCVLFLGSQRLGLADGKPLRLPAGTHRLRCVHFRERFFHHLTVRLHPERTTRLKRTFRRGKLFVLSFPTSTLFLKAKGQAFGLIGRSHEMIALYEGSYRLYLHKQGNPKHKKVLNILIRPGRVFRPKVIW